MTEETERKLTPAAEAALGRLPAEDAKPEPIDPVTAERNRCAKIAEAEGAEYKRQIDEHNAKLTEYPTAADIPRHVSERGWHLHGLRYASDNIAALIRNSHAA